MVEKFFWDLVSEPLSSDTSSFAVAFRMLLKEKRKIKNLKTARRFNRDCKCEDDRRLVTEAV